MTSIKPTLDPYASVTQSLTEAVPALEADAPPVSHEEFEAVQHELDQALAKADSLTADPNPGFQVEEQGGAP